jgi:imidazolonepropionase-like amidohydrolase
VPRCKVAGSRIIDAAGKFVVPGLIDTIHLSLRRRGRAVRPWRSLPPAQKEIVRAAQIEGSTASRRCGTATACCCCR